MTLSRQIAAACAKPLARVRFCHHQADGLWHESCKTDQYQSVRRIRLSVSHVQSPSSPDRSDVCGRAGRRGRVVSGACVTGRSGPSRDAIARDHHRESDSVVADRIRHLLPGVSDPRYRREVDDLRLAVWTVVRRADDRRGFDVRGARDVSDQPLSDSRCGRVPLQPARRASEPAP